jgi:hypothetical protein
MVVRLEEPLRGSVAPKVKSIGWARKAMNCFLGEGEGSIPLENVPGMKKKHKAPKRWSMTMRERGLSWTRGEVELE